MYKLELPSLFNFSLMPPTWPARLGGSAVRVLRVERWVISEMQEAQPGFFCQKLGWQGDCDDYNSHTLFE